MKKILETDVIMIGYMYYTQSPLISMCVSMYEINVQIHHHHPRQDK